MTLTMHLERHNGYATLTLDRPDKLNAINTAMRQQLVAHVETINDDQAIRAVLLQSSTKRAFSAGSDIYDTQGVTPFGKRRQVSEEAANILRRCLKPVVAAISGYCLGGGLELALACDIRIAAENSIFGFPEIDLGWLPAGAGGTQVLPRLVGPGRAAYLIMSGKRIDARTALEWGLVEQVVPEETLASIAAEFVAGLSQKRGEALQLAKSAIAMAGNVSLDAGLEYERELIALCYTFPDRQAYIDAFRKRRGAKSGAEG